MHTPFRTTQHTRSLKNTSLALRAVGRNREAVEMMERAVAMRVVCFGPDHPKTASCREWASKMQEEREGSPHRDAPSPNHPIASPMSKGDSADTASSSRRRFFDFKRKSGSWRWVAFVLLRMVILAIVFDAKRFTLCACRL